MLLLVPTRPQEVVASVTPASAREGFAKRMQTSVAFVGAPLTLFPTRFGLEPGAALKAFARYAADPAAREELRPKPELPG